MEPSSAASWALGALALGPITHKAYFVRGEHHMQAPVYFILFLTLVAVCFVPSVDMLLRAEFGLTQPVKLLFLYLSSLFTSIVIYRLFFHQLRHFPGPRLVAITKLWHSWKTRTSQNHFVLDEWQKYGTFVRTGPNEITVYHEDALDALHGLRSDCTKPDWYDILRPHVAINTTRDKREHELRRKAYNPSFTKDALPTYDVTYKKQYATAEKIIRQQGEKEVEMTELIYRMSLDIMGEVTFSKPFQTLTHDHSRHITRILRRFLSLLGPFSPIPWAIILGSRIPGIMDHWNIMFDECAKHMKERIQKGSVKPDIAGRVAKALDLQPNDFLHLSGDAVALVIAGSDTWASTLVNSFLHLAKEPVYQERILQELEENGITDVAPADVQNLPFLAAFLDEVLRVHHPIPTGTPRNTGPQGLTIAGQYIPPGTTVVAPRRQIARLPHCFYDPDVFDPTRWLKEGEGDSKGPHNTRAYQPFGAGKYGCIGRALALRQARTFIAEMVTKFTMELGQNEDGVAVESELRDEFTAFPGPLNVRFYPREVSV